MRQIISSLDLGSNSIKLVVGEMFEGKLLVLSGVNVKSKGIKNGLITDEEKATEAIKQAVKKIESILGIKINKVVLSVPSFSTQFIKGEGTISFDEEKTIEGSDITDVLQASVYKRVSSNFELVSAAPVDFIVDDEKIVKDPKGLTATKLSVNSILTTIPKKNITSLYNCLDSLGIKIADLAFGELADYYEFKINDMEGKTVGTINIGEDKTEIGVIEDGVLVGCEILEIGGKNIDRDIAYIYDLSLEESRKLKEDFALCHKSNASTSEIVEVTTKSDEKIKINQYEVSEIVYSRMREILDTAKKSINILTKHEISYIIVTGGSSEIDGFMKVYHEVFNNTRALGSVEDVGVRNNKYSTSLGLIKLYEDKLSFRGKTASTVTQDNQKLLFSNKKKNDNGFFGKIYNYFFDN